MNKFRNRIWSIVLLITLLVSASVVSAHPVNQEDKPTKPKEPKTSLLVEKEEGGVIVSAEASVSGEAECESTIESDSVNGVSVSVKCSTGEQDDASEDYPDESEIFCNEYKEEVGDKFDVYWDGETCVISIGDTSDDFEEEWAEFCSELKDAVGDEFAEELDQICGDWQDEFPIEDGDDDEWVDEFEGEFPFDEEEIEEWIFELEDEFSSDEEIEEWVEQWEDESRIDEEVIEEWVDEWVNEVPFDEDDVEEWVDELEDLESPTDYEETVVETTTVGETTTIVEITIDD